MQALARKGADMPRITVLLNERNRSLFGDAPRRGKPPAKAKKPQPLAEGRDLSAEDWTRRLRGEPTRAEDAFRKYWVRRLLGG
jgi:hypothetical protein